MKADQKSRGRFLGGTVPFGYRLGDDGERVPEAEQEAIREMVELRAQGRSLRAIAASVQAKGLKISHQGVADVTSCALCRSPEGGTNMAANPGRPATSPAQASGMRPWQSPR